MTNVLQTDYVSTPQGLMLKSKLEQETPLPPLPPKHFDGPYAPTILIVNVGGRKKGSCYTVYEYTITLNYKPYDHYALFKRLTETGLLCYGQTYDCKYLGTGLYVRRDDEETVSTYHDYQILIGVDSSG